MATSGTRRNQGISGSGALSSSSRGQKPVAATPVGGEETAGVVGMLRLVGCATEGGSTAGGTAATGSSTFTTGATTAGATGGGATCAGATGAGASRGSAGGL